MRKFLNRKVLSVILALAVAWLGDAAYHVHAQRAAIEGQMDDLASKVSHVQQDNQFLASSSAYFQSDEYLEKQARLKLNYKFSDEQVAFIYPDKGEQTASASAVAGTSVLSGWTSWLTHLFK